MPPVECRFYGHQDQVKFRRTCTELDHPTEGPLRGPLFGTGGRTPVPAARLAATAPIPSGLKSSQTQWGATVAPSATSSPTTKQKGPCGARYSYRWSDSNRHSFRGKRILSPSRLPFRHTGQKGQNSAVARVRIWKYARALTAFLALTTAPERKA